MSRHCTALAALIAVAATAFAGVLPARAADALPAEGHDAPEFRLPSTAGHPVRLKDLRGRTVVLYFYPKDETPGCTREACDFRDHTAALDSAGIVVLGVSLDDMASHQHFREKEHLPFTLLADVGGKVARAYGVYRGAGEGGRTSPGVERTTFVIDRRGRIARVWPHVSVNGHVEDVLAFVREH